jgi:fructan beta-fructosidase
MRKGFVFVFLVLLSHSTVLSQAFKEKYRPRYHFTPNKNWINDPNGLVFYAGEYHLFYQYNPFGNQWGHMSWGHSVSTDLVHWKELPVAIPEENNVGIFSGSAVVDPFNTSGFIQVRGQVPMVAIYTADVPNTNQSQHIAYSLDSGRTFTKFRFNPVLDLEKKEFRDPKVFWHEPSKKWVMAVMLPHEKKVQFYSSKSLKAWTQLSEFGPAGDTAGVWECPDLFRVPVADVPGKFKWVFMHSPSPYMQYFVGEFDGTKFINESAPDKILRPDYGPDYYAAIVYNNLPPGKAPISIGWANNWNYAGAIPAGEWRGSMSLPRTLQLKKVENDWILLQNPVDEVATLKTSEVQLKSDKPIRVDSQSFMVEWEWNTEAAGSQEMVVGANDLVVRFNTAAREVVIDRSGSKGFDNEAYRRLSVYKAVVPGKLSGPLKFRLYFDASVAELYVGNGEVAMTAQVFPAEPISNISFKPNGPSHPVILRTMGAYRDNMK